jgi:hypothetical protein
MIPYDQLDQNSFDTSSITSMKRVQLPMNKSCEIYIGSHKDRHSCLIRIDTESDCKFPSLNGVRTFYDKYIYRNAGDDENKINCIIIACEDRTLLNEYLLLLKQILKSLDHEPCNDKSKINNIDTVLKRHQYFYGRNQDVLKVQEQIGLLGELVYLYKILIDDPEYGILHWVANEAGDDFLYSDILYALEVKATTNNRHMHVINGLAQLSIVLGNRKDILSLIFKNDPQKNTHNITLPIIITNIERLLGDHVSNIDEFNRKLSERGYSRFHDNEYEGKYYSLIAAKTYEINDSFPKITEASFKDPLPKGVSSVRYTIDLSYTEGINFDTTFMNTLIR